MVLDPDRMPLYSVDTPDFDYQDAMLGQQSQIEGWFGGIHELAFGVPLSRCPMVAVTFVPSFSRSSPGWMADLSSICREGGPRSAQQARLWAAALAHYAVTPDDERAGRIESFTDPQDEPFETVLWYVDTGAYAVFQAELDAYAGFDWNGDALGPEPEQFACVKYLRTVLFPSPAFEPRVKRCL